MKRLNATPRSLAQWIIDEGLTGEMQILVASMNHFVPKTAVACLDESMAIVKAHYDWQDKKLKWRVSVESWFRKAVHALIRILRTLRIQQLALELRSRKSAA